jgi:hypothetical protein
LEDPGRQLNLGLVLQPQFHDCASLPYLSRMKARNTGMIAEDSAQFLICRRAHLCKNFRTEIHVQKARDEVQIPLVVPHPCTGPHQNPEHALFSSPNNIPMV